MAKQIIYGEQSRQAILRGVNQLADAVKADVIFLAVRFGALDCVEHCRAHLRRPTGRSGRRGTREHERADGVGERRSEQGAQANIVAAEQRRSGRATASITARRSSICSSRVGGRSSGSDRPVPRRSSRTSLVNDANRRSPRAVPGSAQGSLTCDVGPRT